MKAVLGHDGAVAAFRAAMDEGRVHHAWLLAGPHGVGKARFADAAAARFLAEGAGPVGAPGIDLDETHPTARLIAAGSHPDFQRLERLYREKPGDHARNITVDQVRGLQRLFATTPSFSTRRAIVIDAADDMERGAANALLKNLEEPPADTLFLLVSHAPGRLLPTIRSRCRILRFQSLGDDVMTSVLHRAMPEAPPATIAELIAIADGAPGQALRFADLDVAGLDRAMARIAREGDPDNALRSALAKSLATKAAQPRYEAFLERAPSLFAAHARTATGGALASAVVLWEQARGLASAARALSLDPQTTVFEISGLLAALAPAGVAAKA